MKKSPDLYDVWADGSWRNDTVGAAWKIVHAGETVAGSKAVTKLHKDDKPRGSDIAELIAVRGALANIPSGADVHLRLDAQPVIDMLMSKRIPGKDKDVPVGLKAAFSGAVAEIEKLGSCQITKVSDKTNADMQEVNRLARTASGKTSREAASLLRRDL